MFVTAICPTYRHPTLLANSLACWLAQDYPADQRHLVILDDGETFDFQGGPSWSLFTRRPRFGSIGEKYNALLTLSPPETEAFLVWEDDDIYGASFVSAHARALEACQFSKPATVLSDYTGRIAPEPAAGRFHSCMGFRRELIERIGGWPDTKRADFDQQLIARLHQHADCTADPWPDSMPQFIYRWHSGAAHCQSTMRSPDDTTWWDRNEQAYAPVPFVGKLVASMDDATRRAFQELQPA